MALYLAVVFGIMYLLLSTFPFVFGEQYNFSAGTVGLSYIPTGVGCMLGMLTFGTLTDRIVKKKMDRGETPVPEDRIPPMMTVPCGFIIVGSLFLYGWTAEYKIHWIVPMLGVALFCFGLMGIMVSCAFIKIFYVRLTRHRWVFKSTSSTVIFATLRRLLQLSRFSDLLWVPSFHLVDCRCIKSLATVGETVYWLL